MNYFQIAGFMADKIKDDKITVLSPSLDIEKMEAEEVSGFSVTLPQEELPLPYQSDDIEVIIVENVKTTDTAITVNDASGMSNGEYWIKNELIYVFDIFENTTDWTLLVVRGRNRTFAQKYTINESTSQHYFVRKYPKTFIGQRVFLWEDTKLLSIGLITKQPIFDGTVMKFDCDNAISSLDVAWSIPSGSSFLLSVFDDASDEESSAAIRTKGLNLLLSSSPTSDYGFEFELPPIMDYVTTPFKANITTGASNNTYVKLEDLDTILDYLKLYGKLNGSVFTWDHTREVYTFVSISDISSLDTAPDAYLSKYVDTSKSYSSELYTGISQIKISLRNTVININNTNTSQFTKSEVLEIDLSKYIGITPADTQSIVYFYIRLFSVIYAKLTIPTHALKFEDFTEGHFYNALDIDKFYTFQNVSSRVFCMSKDGDNIIFLVTRDIVKNPVAPAILVEALSSVLTADANFTEFINTTGETIETAVVPNYSIHYFEAGDKVMFVRSDGVKFNGLTITSVSGNIIAFSSPIFTPGDKGYLTYDEFSVCVARQQKFFFLDTNNW